MTKQTRVPLTEPVPAPTIWVKGLGRVDVDGPCATFVLYAENKTEFGDDLVPERAIQVRIVMPLESILPAVRMALAATGPHFFDTESDQNGKRVLS